MAIPVALLTDPLHAVPAALRPALFETRDRVVAAFTTRHGGVSASPYASFNLGLHTEDDPAAVRENRERLAALFDMKPDRLATAGQVHGTTVRVVDAPGHVSDCDGLVTTTPNVLLCISAADCAAVLLADLEARVVGACHAGWRGAAGGIAAITTARMVDLGAQPARIYAYVSPCISVEHFEVGPEVAAQFDDAVVYHRPGKDRPHVDLKGAITRQLTEKGVPATHIEVSPHCTMAETDTFFSHRGEQGKTGRMMGCIGLRN